MAIPQQRINTRVVRRTLTNVFGANPFDGLRQLNTNLATALSTVRDLRQRLSSDTGIGAISDLFKLKDLTFGDLDNLAEQLFGISIGSLRSEFDALMSELDNGPLGELRRQLLQSSHLLSALGYELGLLQRYGATPDIRNNYNVDHFNLTLLPGSFSMDQWGDPYDEGGGSYSVGGASGSGLSSTGTVADGVVDIVTPTVGAYTPMDYPLAILGIAMLIHKLPDRQNEILTLFENLSPTLGQQIAAMVTAIGINQQDFNTIYVGLTHGDVATQIATQPTLLPTVLSNIDNPYAIYPIIQLLDTEYPDWWTGLIVTPTGLTIEDSVDTLLHTLLPSLGTSATDVGNMIDVSTAIPTTPGNMTGSQVLTAISEVTVINHTRPFTQPRSLYETYTGIDA